eukprot:gene5875-7311_t
MIPGVPEPGAPIKVMNLYSLPGIRYDGYLTSKLRDTCNPKQDAEKLHHAFKGIGTDEKEIIKILGNRNYTECEYIKGEYGSLYKRDLITDIKSETSSNFESLLVAILMNPCDLEAKYLYDAMKGIGTDEGMLIQILVPTNNAQKDTIKRAFVRLYKKSLDDMIGDDTSGDLKKALTSLLLPRDEGYTVDKKLVERDVEDLYNAGEKKVGTNEETFIHILTRRDFEHVNQVAHVYEEKHNKQSLESVIDKEFSGYIKKLLISILWAARSLTEYNVRAIRNCIEGSGTKDQRLIHAIVSANPIMNSVKKLYSVLYGTSLHDDVKKDTSGDYQKLFLELIESSHDF